ncbi:MAG TPA: TlpA disulfide reductase family protein [Thermoanaerobaculia bacterium]|nr:TlpA disulfide reductase family protein [Thermoanaerobaculia bacterium]
MNKKVLLVGVLLVLPLMALLAVSFKFDPKVVESPLLGKPAPEFTLQDLEGRVYSLSDLRGMPVVINFWSTWCPPCIQEHPWLTAASRRYAGRVHFLGVIYQDDADTIRRFLRERGAWGPSLVDPDNRVALAYGVFGPPETFFLDAEGTVVDKVIGAVPPSYLAEMLESLL